MKIILASNSPRRKELLGKIVPQFEIIPSVSPENSSSADPRVYVQELATQKATEVFASHSDCLVLGCDTVVALEGKIMGKPHTPQEAWEMLTALSGKTHHVHTGVCILCGSEKIVFCDTTAVQFCQISPQDLQKYIDSGSPFDKAGGYGIQDCGFVCGYTGSYDNVMGFPTERIQPVISKLTK